MIGLEIIINDQKPIIAASDSLVFMDLSYGYSFDQISVMGGDDLRILTWFNGKPKKGDKVVVRIVEIDIDKVSPVIKVMDRDRNEIKELYERYEVELQNKGLI